MSKASHLIIAVAAIGLAACTNDPIMAAQRADLVPLLDNTGTAVMYVPVSATRGAPVGTPVVVNRNGQMQTLTLGERQGGVSAGNVTIVGNDAGSPQMVRVGGTGDMSPTGAAVVTGNTDGRPTTSYVDPATLPQSRRQRQAAEREAQRAAAAAAAATNPPAR